MLKTAWAIAGSPQCFEVVYPDLEFIEGRETQVATDMLQVMDEAEGPVELWTSKDRLLAVFSGLTGKGLPVRAQLR